MTKRRPQPLYDWSTPIPGSGPANLAAETQLQAPGSIGAQGDLHFDAQAIIR